MKTPTNRDRILGLLQDLPADATVEDAMERLYFLSKVERGIKQADRGQEIPHAEVKKRFLE